MPRGKRAGLALVGLGLLIVGAVVAPRLHWPTRGRSLDPTAKGPSDEQPLPGFRAVTSEAGIDFKMAFLKGEQGSLFFKVNLYDHGCGLAVGDCDGDGDDDLYFCNQLGGNALFVNEGQGKFRNATREAGPIALDDRISVGATFSDYDNDGDQDLFVTSTRGGNALFQNDGRGVFRDVTTAAGVDLTAHSQTAAFFDLDLDGDLDLFVTNSASWTTDQFDPEDKYFIGPADIFSMVGRPIEKNVCYRNNGDGTFTDITSQVGLEGVGWAGDVAVCDYDSDGRSDLLVTNMFGQSQLLRNQPDGVFADVTAQTLKRTSWGAIGAVAADFGNTGRFDFLIADMHSDMWMPIGTPPSEIEESKKYRWMGGKFAETSQWDADKEAKLAEFMRLKYDQVLFGNTLFQNLGEGRFEEISSRANVETFWPWGIATGDFDNDGFQDLFVPSGMGHPYFYWRNYLLMNNGDMTFTDESRRRGVEPRPGGPLQDERIVGTRAVRSSRCAATADFNGDGRLDLIVGNFNDAPYLYFNEFPEQNYIQFRLQGVRANRDGIGAVVRVFAGDQTMTRQVNAAGGYLSHSSKTLHFGLGNRPSIERVEIRWPGGGTQVIERPAINQLHHVMESS